jgi:hypothetical protein
VNLLGESANFLSPTSARVTKSFVSKCSPPEFHPKTAMLELTHNHKPSPFPTCRLRKWQRRAWQEFDHIASIVDGVETLVRIAKLGLGFEKSLSDGEMKSILFYLGS